MNEHFIIRKKAKQKFLARTFLTCGVDLLNIRFVFSKKKTGLNCKERTSHVFLPKFVFEGVQTNMRQICEQTNISHKWQCIIEEIA